MLILNLSIARWTSAHPYYRRSGLRQYDGTMRMVSTNSLAISAACHVLREDREGGCLLPVQWGVVKMTGGVGKCSFTTAAADTVKPPETGSMYK